MPHAITVNERVTVPEAAITFTTARASGPGGQNVNKVASKVDVRVDLDQVTGLDVSSRARLRAIAARRLDAAGLLQVVSQKTRDQGRNLEDAYEKIKAMIEKALVAPEVRKPTKPSRGAVKRRLSDKRQTGERKRQRTGRVAED